MHFTTFIVSAALVATGLAVPAVERRTLPTTSENQDLINKLILAPTALERIELLPNDTDFAYDFLNPPTPKANTTGLGTLKTSPLSSIQLTKLIGGHTTIANRATCPGLIGTGSSMTVGFLGPCGMNTPHTHPRGTELNIVVQGSLMTTMIGENGARAVSNYNTLYQMSIFPQGALHMEFNPNCTPAVFVAAFNNEDAGTQQTADAFFKLSDDVITAALGGDVMVDGRDVDQVKGMIPANVAKGVEECLTTCGLKKR